MRATYSEPERCDDLSQMVLSALHKRGRASTSQLRRMTGGDSSSIRYRIDEYLSPAGLVREVDRKEHAGNDVRVFELTNEGQMYVSDMWSDLTHYARRHEVLDAAEETHDRLDLLHDRIDDFERRLDEMDEDIEGIADELFSEWQQFRGGMEGNFSQLREQVASMEEQLEAEQREREKLEERVDELEQLVGSETDMTTRRDETLVEAVVRNRRLVEEAWARVMEFEIETGVANYLSVGKAKELVSAYGPRELRDWRR